MKRKYSEMIGMIGLCLCAIWSTGAAASPTGHLLVAQQASSETAVSSPSEASRQAQDAAPVYAQVNAILQQRCVMCHTGPQAAANLRLDSYADVMAGGTKGPAVIPKSPEKSELLRRIRGVSQPRMPMNGPPWLAESETSVIEQWIATGAIDAPIGGAKPTKPEGQAKQDAPTSIAAPSAGAPLIYTDVAPIFLKRCVKCHMAKGSMGTPPEGIRLDNHAAILSAPERPIVIPGYPETSLLFRTIKGLSLPRMPMDGPPYLDDQEMEKVARWIAQGARDAGGKAASVPVGANVRLTGTLTGRWVLDGVALAVDSGTRMDKNPSPGNLVEVRAVVREDGSLRAVRIRRR